MYNKKRIFLVLKKHALRHIAQKLLILLYTLVFTFIVYLQKTRHLFLFSQFRSPFLLF